MALTQGLIVFGNPYLNISSVIVHALPEKVQAVRARLAEIDGVEVHVASDEGKIVATIETEDDASTSSLFESLGKLENVLSTSMVFHQSESDPDKEICNETDAA